MKGKEKLFFDFSEAYPLSMTYRHPLIEVTNKNAEVLAHLELPYSESWDNDRLAAIHSKPPGVLHAPASLCTYEPQFASDVYAMYQSVLYGSHIVSKDLLWKNCTEGELGNYDYLMDVIDWEANIDPNFHQNRFMKPMVCCEDERFYEEWICYKSPTVSAKRVTVNPSQTVLIKDAAAYGMILIQGYGKMGKWEISTPTLIRYGELTNDEFFVSEATAKEGVKITNTSATEPLVMLKHFSENPELVIE